MLTPAAPDIDLPQYADAEAIARHFGVTPRTVRAWTARGILPPPIRLGHRRLWDVQRLRDYLGSQSKKKEAACG